MTIDLISKIKIIITLTVIVILILLTMYPVPLKYVIKKYTKGPRYDKNENALEVDEFTLYQNETVPNKPNALLICFNGGAFLFSEKKTMYGLLNKISDSVQDYNIDILVFNYPIRFKYTIHDSLVGCNEVISKVLKIYNGRYQRFYGLGYSAGVILMGAFQRKETVSGVSRSLNIPILGVKLSAMICINGLYSLDLYNKLINQLFKWYIVRGTALQQYYSAYKLEDTPKLIIGAEYEFLYAQTHLFLNSEPTSKSLIFNNKELTHLFPLYYETSESQQCVSEIASFLINLQQN